MHLRIPHPRAVGRCKTMPWFWPVRVGIHWETKKGSHTKFNTYTSIVLMWIRYWGHIPTHDSNCYVYCAPDTALIRAAPVPQISDWHVKQWRRYKGAIVSLVSSVKGYSIDSIELIKNVTTIIRQFWDKSKLIFIIWPYFHEILVCKFGMGTKESAHYNIVMRGDVWHQT